MRFRNIALIFTVAILSVFAFTQLSISQKPWRQFYIVVPEEVSASPGDIAVIDGGVMNTGWWWLHDFKITLAGLPEGYNYTVTPGHWDDLRILREWNSEQGVYRVPERFKITIDTPKDAHGIYTVNVTGQESQSHYKLSNVSFFVLKILTMPNFTISDIVIPEQVIQNEPFNISFEVKNTGEGAGTINLLMKTPATWNVSKKTFFTTLNSNQSEQFVATMIPTNESGDISIYAEYPYKAEVINITRVGPVLTPMTKEAITPTPPEVPVNVTGLSVLIQKLTEPIAGMPWWILIIIIILLIVIVWNLWIILKNYRIKFVRGKEEKMEVSKKDVEELPTSASGRNVPESF